MAELTETIGPHHKNSQELLRWLWDRAQTSIENRSARVTRFVLWTFQGFQNAAVLSVAMSKHSFKSLLSWSRFAIWIAIALSPAIWSTRVGCLLERPVMRMFVLSLTTPPLLPLWPTLGHWGHWSLRQHLLSGTQSLPTRPAISNISGSLASECDMMLDLVAATSLQTALSGSFLLCRTWRSLPGTSLEDFLWGTNLPNNGPRTVQGDQTSFWQTKERWGRKPSLNLFPEGIQATEIHERHSKLFPEEIVNLPYSGLVSWNDFWGEVTIFVATLSRLWDHRGNSF